MNKVVVHLVGAGPGDIELMTLKSLRLIKEAQVIIYDRLANPEILKEAPKNCKFIDVGKTDGKHPVKQDEINEILYQSSLKYNNPPPNQRKYNPCSLLSV